MISPSRVRPQNTRPINPHGAHVLYWMVASRRIRYNFALQHAAELSHELGKPLIILEALRADYPFACARFHAFVIDGMHGTARALDRHSGVAYYPYVEPAPGAGAGLLHALTDGAAAVVTDWWPAFFLPRMLAAAAEQCPVRLVAVDGNGLVPVADHGRAFPSARGYRAFVQRTLRAHLAQFPVEDPLTGLHAPAAAIPKAVVKRWAPADLTRSSARLVASLPIDQSPGPVATPGGETAARKTLRAFLETKLDRYAETHNDPDADCTSRLSPYLHFGHISAHEIFAALATRERWTTRKLGAGRSGAREGWWGVSASAEQFLDQIVVWRELAFNGCSYAPNYHSFETLPAWARTTLTKHLVDERPHLYRLEQLEAAETHDQVWNAAQRQLREDGWFHGYMRMVWGKKILEWSREPAEALDRMETLMNRYSLDGRDPVSYLNFGWVLGRYDRPWPERPIFGTVRYMTSESARRKLKMKEYLARYGGADPQATLFAR